MPADRSHGQEAQRRVVAVFRHVGAEEAHAVAFGRHEPSSHRERPARGWAQSSFAE